MTEAKPSSKRSPRKQERAQASSQGSINAGLGGAGGGTGMIAIAQVVGVHTVPGQILMYVAPTVSVIAGTLLYQLRLQTDWYSERWQVKRARKTLERQLRYPHTSEEHKAELRKILEELDRAVASAQLERVRLIGPPFR